MDNARTCYGYPVCQLCGKTTDAEVAAWEAAIEEYRQLQQRRN